MCYFCWHILDHKKYSGPERTQTPGVFAMEICTPVVGPIPQTAPRTLSQQHPVNIQSSKYR